MNLTVFLTAVLVSYVLTFFLRQLAWRCDLLDYPRGHKNHNSPIPYLGGCALFVSFWLVVFCGIFAAFCLGYPQGVVALAPKIIGIFVGSAVIFLVGLLDDKFHWPPFRKLLGQMAAAAILMSLGLAIHLVAGLGLAGYLITFLWILLIINAFNFIDSLDGHCVGVALISALVFFGITRIVGQPLPGLLLATFAGALAGFLPHNFKPARIFLGDNGSLWIGYMMAAFTLLCRYQPPQATYATLFIPLLVCGVPIYDTLSVITVRLLRGIAPWEGDRNHFAHRLVKIGMSERVAVVFSYFVALMLGLIALLTTQVTPFGALLVGLIFVSMIGVISFMEFYATEKLKNFEIERGRDGL